MPLCAVREVTPARLVLPPPGWHPAARVTQARAHSRALARACAAVRGRAAPAAAHTTQSVSADVGDSSAEGPPRPASPTPAAATPSAAIDAAAASCTCARARGAPSAPRAVLSRCEAGRRPCGAAVAVLYQQRHVRTDCECAALKAGSPAKPAAYPWPL